MEQSFGPQTTTRPPVFIGDHLVRVTLDLRGRARAISFVVAYAPTETTDVAREDVFMAARDGVGQDILSHEQMTVLMNSNAHTGKRDEGEVGRNDNEVQGTYGLDTLLTFAANHGLTLVHHVPSTALTIINESSAFP